MRPSRFNLRIYYDPSPLHWAQFFVEQNPNLHIDEEAMFIWFSNAMEAAKEKEIPEERVLINNKRRGEGK